jgi:putative protease
MKGAVGMNKPELLAPAGSLEKLKYALHYGADAVYIGGRQYGLRSNADNFSVDEMREAVRIAETYGAKVYVTTNIFAHEEDLDGIADYLRQLEDAGIAAIITADPALIETARRAAPRLDVHLSTQQSTLNWLAVQFWKEEGLPRVVLAREASLEDIRFIKDKVDIEIETFIHGAMCSSYSGRCVLSNHFTGRDSNRGGCVQSCRWRYDLYERGGGPVGILEREEDKFTLGAKDLGMIEHIPDLVAAGIDSFKIEGRMRSLHYVASVVHAYRKAIDAWFADPGGYELRGEWIGELLKAANRPLNTGFYFHEPGADDHIYEPEDKPMLVDFAGVVLDYDESTGEALIEQRNHFKPGQTVEFFSPDGVRFRMTVPELADESGRKIDAARHPLQKVRMRTEAPVKPMDIMRKWLA